MGKASNGKPKSVKPKSDHAARKYETRVVAIDAVAPHPRNTAYHAHPESQIEMLAQSAQTFGQYKNIVVWKKQIIAGAGIWAGLKKAGATEIEIKDVSHLTQAQAFALMTADNETQKGAVTNDAELAALVREVMEAEGEALARLAAGEQKALDALLAQGNAVEETADVGELIDRAAELQKKWNVARGDIFEIESKTARGKFHRIMCGDSTSKEDVERLMQGESVKLFITDPPYGVGYEYESHDDSDENAYFILCHEFMKVAQSLQCFGLVTAGHKHNNWWMREFNPDSFVVWFDKTKQSPHKIAYLCKSELVLSFGKPNARYSWDTIEVQGVRGDGVRELHTCPKPTELFVKLIEPQTERSDAVIDFFLGSGTTLIACEQTGRIGRGMELEPKYVSVALERLSALGLEPRRVTETEKRNGKQKRA